MRKAFSPTEVRLNERVLIQAKCASKYIPEQGQISAVVQLFSWNTTPEVKEDMTAAISWWAYLHSADRNASQVHESYADTRTRKVWERDVPFLYNVLWNAK